MGWITRSVLIGTLAAAVATNLPAQRGGFYGGAAVPSATAIGAGALSHGPSTTARSTAAGRPSIYTPSPFSHGFRSSGYRNGAGYESRGAYGRDNRRMPFAYWISPYYYPGFDYGLDDSNGAPGPDMSYDPSVDAAMAAQNALVDQVRRLSAEVAQLQGGQPMQPPAPQEPLPPQIPVTLVLRNGQQVQVQNYAVMDQTFWDFSKQTVHKIPLSSIDVAASARATEAKGGEFPQLATP